MIRFRFTSRPGRSRRIAHGLAVAAPVLLLLGPPAGAATLEERLASLAATPGETLAYEEERRSGLLNRPVTVRGRLSYDPDTRTLVKWVDSPREARLTVSETHLEARTGSGRTRRLPLERRPDLAALLDGLRALLAGDPEALQARFRTDYLEGDGGAWVMQLVPRDPSLAGQLEMLEVRGTEDRVGAIDTVLADGERQQMRILPRNGAAPQAPERNDGGEDDAP